MDDGDGKRKNEATTQRRVIYYILVKQVVPNKNICTNANDAWSSKFEIERLL